MINKLKEKILGGGEISAEEAYELCELAPERREELYEAAAEITKAFCPVEFDSCSIVNARSGKCSENCKWCAQSAHFNTKVNVYPLIDREEIQRHAQACKNAGIKRFSMVTSGRKMSGRDLERACGYYGELNREGGVELCASMGLLTKDELQKLWDAGVRRYHCNLEAAPDHFATLCTTHTVEDKIKTINAAREIGFEVCSGGIIGMGENARQRVGLALELRRVRPHSIPINILCPIPGTPLENSQPLTTDEIFDAIALFRFIHPHTTLRFAGGRASLTRKEQLKAIKIGMNGGVVGDLLTTVGSTVADDKALVAEAGLKF